MFILSRRGVKFGDVCEYQLVLSMVVYQFETHFGLANYDARFSCIFPKFGKIHYCFSTPVALKLSLHFEEE